MFDDDGRLVAYTVRYSDKVNELKARSVTIYTLHACNKIEKIINDIQYEKLTGNVNCKNI